MRWGKLLAIGYCYSRFGRFRHFDCAPLELLFAQRNDAGQLFDGILGYGGASGASAVAGAAASIRLLNVYLGGIDTARHGPVHIPKGSLLRIENLALQLVPLLGHFALRLRLAVDQWNSIQIWQ